MSLTSVSSRFRCLCFSTCVAAMFIGRPPTNAADTAATDAAQRDYLSANGLLNRGMNDLAAAEYRKFLAAHGTHEKAPTARYGLCVALFRLGQFDEALTELKTVPAGDGFAFGADAAVLTGQCHLVRERYAPAAQAFQAALARFPEHPLADDAGAGATEALYLAGENDRAVEQAKDFTRRFADSPLRERVLYFWGLAESQRGDPAAAAQRFDELLRSTNAGEFAEPSALLLAQSRRQSGALDQALAGYRSIVQRGGKFLADALAALSALLYERGDLDESAENLDRLMREFPSHPQLAEAKLQRARIRFDKGDHKAALAEFTDLMGTPLSDQASYWSAKCRLRMDEPAAAAKLLAGAAKASPSSPLLPEMRFDQAVALHRAGEMDEAARTLEQFRVDFPKHRLDGEALRLLAAVEHQRRDFTKSAALCASYLQANPTGESAAEIQFLAAENALLSGDAGGSVAMYQSFLGEHPSDPQAPKAKFRLGLTLHSLQRSKEALPYLNELAELTGGERAYCPVLLALGDIALAGKEWKSAEQRLSAYTICDPKQVADDAWLKLGLARSRQERYEEAITAYDKVLASSKVAELRTRAQFERSVCLVSLDRGAEAVKGFESVVSEGEGMPLQAHALEQLAALAAKSGRASDAAALFQRAASSDSSGALSADAMFNQAVSEMNAGRFADAEATFKRFLSGFASHARADEAESRLGIAVARQERFADAMLQLDSAVDRLQKLPEGLRSAIAYERAWCLRRLDRKEEAISAYKSIGASKDGGGYGLHALLELGEMDMEAGRFADAAATLRRLAESLESRSEGEFAELRANGLYRLGICEHQLERFAEAAQLLDAFLSANPNHALTASARFYCGDSLNKLGRHEPAIRQFTAIVKENKSDPVFGPALLRLGDSLSVMQRWALAEQTFSTYLDRFAESDQAYQAHFGRGWAVENQGRYDEAVKSYSDTIAAHQGPTAARAQFQIGQCLFAQKKFDDAVRELLKVDILYAYPDWSAAALYEAGRCFEKLGKAQEARNSFQQVEEKYAKTQWAELAKERLAGISSAEAVPGR